MNFKQPSAFALIGLLLLGLIYWPFISGQREFFDSDITYLYQPVCAYIGQALKEGRLPLWNPSSYCGMPQMAVLSPGIFYPFTYLMALCPFSAGEGIYLLLHQLILAIATFLYLRRQEFSQNAAILGSYCLSFCGYMFAMQKFPDYVATVSWLPLTLFAALSVSKATADRTKTLYLILLSLSVALMIYAGRPEIFLPGLALVVWQIIALAAKNPRDLLFSFAALISGIMLCAPALLPAAEWLSLSPRAKGINISESFIWSAHWYDWLSMIFLEPFGNFMEKFGPESDRFLDLINKDSRRTPLLSAVYIGPGFFTVFLLGLFDKSFKHRWIYLLLGGFFALLAAGDQTPVAPFLSALFPQLQILRYPVKLLIFPVMAATVLACRGFQHISRNHIPDKILILLTAFWTMFFLSGTIFYFIPETLLFVKNLALAYQIDLTRADLSRLHACLPASLISGACLGLFICLCIYLGQKFNTRKRVALTALSIGIVCPLFFYGLKSSEHGAESGFYTKPQILKEALYKLNPIPTKERILYLNLEPFSIPDLYFANKTGSKAALFHAYARDAMFPNCNFSSGWNYSNGYILAETAQIINIYMAALERSSAYNAVGTTDCPLARFCNLSNTRYIVTKKWWQYAQQMPLLDRRFFDPIIDDDLLNIRVYRSKMQTSRFHFATNINDVVSWSSWEKVAGMLAAPLSMDDSQTYVQSADLPSIDKNEYGIPDPAKATIQVIEDKPERLTLTVNCPSINLLVIRDQFYPGWTAEIDGKNTPVIRANLFNRALLMGKGKHNIVMRYQPESFTKGCLIAFLGILLLTALCLARRQLNSLQSKVANRISLRQFE
ncbi:MAG: YfhO family protein [Candidatus Obscuribacterales bacterium]|nr:YfhO family protein [Candidatus Obscuribacterales bacterium]